jgi:hypothetical protein
MGGLGSGRWGWHYKRATVESCKRFTVRQVLHGWRVGGSLSWTRGGQPAGAISYQVEYTNGKPEWLRLIYTFTDSGVKVDYSIPIVSTLTPWGSPRYWLQCPDCGRRCEILYLPPSGQRFTCRLCGHLTYTTSQESRKSNILAQLLVGMPDLITNYPFLTLSELAALLDCELSGKKPPKRIEQKMRAYSLELALKELHNQPDPYAAYLTPAAICKRSGLSPADLAALNDSRLLLPDRGDLYRPKLASWAGKLAYLLRAGWSLTEIKAWTRGRWQTPDPRRWPPELAELQYTDDTQASKLPDKQINMSYKNDF